MHFKIEDKISELQTFREKKQNCSTLRLSYRLKQEIAFAILFLHHSDNCLGKAVLFGKTWKRVVCANCTMCLSLFYAGRVSNDRVETTVTAQLTYTLLFVSFRTATETVDFPLTFSHGGKTKWWLLRERETFSFGSPF